MARVKTSGLISDIRGKIQGSVFQGYKGGIFVRSSSANINRRSETQQLTRYYTSYLQKQWRELSELNRTKWNNFTTNYLISQKNGGNKHINGQQAFVKINHYRLQYSLGLWEYPRFTNLTMELPTWTIEINGVNLDITCSPTIDENDVFHVFYITPPMTESVNNPGNMLKLMRFETAHSFAYTISNEYIQTFGALPQIGDWVHIKTALASKRNGLLTPWNRQQLQIGGTLGPVNFGNTSNGTFQNAVFAGNAIMYQQICPVNGVLKEFHAYVQDFTAMFSWNGKCALYDEFGVLVPNSESEQHSIPFAPSWVTFPVNSGATLIAGKRYYLAIFGLGATLGIYSRTIVGADSWIFPSLGFPTMPPNVSGGSVFLNSEGSTCELSLYAVIQP